jgi:hypothetical protein
MNEENIPKMRLLEEILGSSLKGVISNLSRYPKKFLLKFLDKLVGYH